MTNAPEPIWPTALPAGVEGIHTGNPVRGAVLERAGELFDALWHRARQADLLPLAYSFQRFQPVGRGHAQVVKLDGVGDHLQLTSSYALNVFR